MKDVRGNNDAHSPAAVAAAGLVALAVAMGIGRFAFTPLLPMMQEDAGLSVAAGGWLASANYLGYLIGALSAVALKVRPAIVIRAGLLAIAVTTFAMGLGHNFSAWIALRLVAGIASAWVLVFVSAWSLAHLARLNRPAMGGVVFTGVGTGITAAGVLCLALMQAQVSSGSAWIAFGVLSLALALAIWPAFEADEGASTPAPAAEAAAGAGNWNGDWWRLILCYGALGFGYIIPATFLPAMAKQIIPDPAVFGWSWPVFGVAAAISTLAAIPLQRIGYRRLWIASQLIMAAGVALPVFRPGIGAILLAALLVGGTVMVTTTVALQEGRDVGRAQARRLIAAMTAAFAVGQIAGPVAAGVAVSATGDFSIALLSASLLLVVSACMLGGRGRKLEEGSVRNACSKSHASLDSGLRRNDDS